MPLLKDALRDVEYGTPDQLSEGGPLVGGGPPSNFVEQLAGQRTVAAGAVRSYYCTLSKEFAESVVFVAYPDGVFLKGLVASAVETCIADFRTLGDPEQLWTGTGSMSSGRSASAYVMGRVVEFHYRYEVSPADWHSR